MSWIFRFGAKPWSSVGTLFIPLALVKVSANGLLAPSYDLSMWFGGNFVLRQRIIKPYAFKPNGIFFPNGTLSVFINVRCRFMHAMASVVVASNRSGA